MMDNLSIDLSNDLQQLLAEAPPAVRKYFASNQLNDFLVASLPKYDLHIDKSAILQREIILLLLGLESPQEFQESLVGEAKLSQDTVKLIAHDINAGIFIPLQKQVITPSPKPLAQMTRVSPALSLAVPLPTPLKPVPPPTGALGSVLRSVAPQAAASVPVRPVSPPVPPMPINRLASSMPKPPAPLPQASQKPLAPPTPGAQATTQRAPQLEEDHRVYVAPLPPKRAMPQPRQGALPPNLPGAPAEKGPAAEVQPGRLLNLLVENQPAPTREAPPAPMSPAPSAAPAPQTAVVAPPVPLTKSEPKPYPTDPYREPLE